MKSSISTFTDEICLKINIYDDLSEQIRRELIRKMVFDEGSVEQDEIRQEVFDTLVSMGYTSSK